MTLLIDASALDDAPSAVRELPSEYTAIKIAEGDLDFEVTGVVNCIATPLGLHRVPILYVSTFATDIFLVPSDRLSDARVALEAHQFVFVDRTADDDLDDSMSSLSDSKCKLFSSAGLDATSVASASAAAKAASASAAPPVSYAPRPAQPHIVFSILPFDLRMVRVHGDLSRFATELLRLILYPKRQDRFFSLVRIGSNELSIICELHEVEPTFDAWVKKHGSACSGDDALPTVTVSPLDWRCVLMCSRGSGLSEFGVMARFTGPLAESSISIFKVTTISNDYSLLRTNDVERALEKLQATFDNVEIVREEPSHY